MLFRNLIFCLFLAGILSACSSNKQPALKNLGPNPDPMITRADWDSYFEACGVEGSIILYCLHDKTWIVSDSLDIHKEALPASTFKIMNLLIALETEVIKDENEVIAWVGETDTTLYGYRPDIYRDMTVREAFEVSAVWVFTELAKRIGKERYRHYLETCGYGNQDLSVAGDDFWNVGSFAISPLNQVNFLRSVYEGKAPFSRRNIDILKQVMIVEKKEGYTIRAKTGWTREGGINTGWWVGYLEKGEEVFFFATRLFQDRKFNRQDFGACRQEITKSVLKEIAALPGFKAESRK